jgi:hypothetical protein
MEFLPVSDRNIADVNDAFQDLMTRGGNRTEKLKTFQEAATAASNSCFKEIIDGVRSLHRSAILYTDIVSERIVLKFWKVPYSPECLRVFHTMCATIQNIINRACEIHDSLKDVEASRDVKRAYALLCTYNDVYEDLCDAHTARIEYIQRHAAALHASGALVSVKRFERCNNCFIDAKTFCCSGCNNAWYCSQECQREHWIEDHRNTCDTRAKKASPRKKKAAAVAV